MQGFYKYRKNDYRYNVISILDEHTSLTDFYNRIQVDDTLRNEDFTLYDDVNRDFCLKYIIDPKGFIIDNDPHYYFDISLSVDTGQYNLNEAEVYMQYSNEWFYENMYSNGYVTFNEGDFKKSV